ncbi:MAG: hypothetical protein ING66_04250 [Rhodocyclaceae bacterium]|jgi:hypothetical protein|nr:hypothetical protein [Rhodocyclaceae bacterium]MCA3018517.1 hypothetical protein [Rhodocyclaceae bacterium]MCA3026914.1 hypothetical protein [Rhodocyclaceae bacterium]MCA3027791.1 hypothetical protein [Rhodocyclaceae bacterium]MCA3031744.1 hypothetical protein [Rhodocyclaceae bacterium]
MSLRWRYAPWRRGRSINMFLREPLLLASAGEDVIAIRQYQSVAYAAVATKAGCVEAWICPLDTTGEHGRHLIGYALLREDVESIIDYPSFNRCPLPILAHLSGASSHAATQWRDRCIAYARARSALGSIKARTVIRTEQSLPAGAYRAFWFYCLDGRRGHYIALDVVGQPPVTLKREAFLSAGGHVVNQSDVNLHNLVIPNMEIGA